MTDHTPVPWRSDTDRVVTDDGLVICDVRHAGTWITEANANLIAAAPELLVALTEALDLFSYEYTYGPDDAMVAANAGGDWVRQARAAIAKATTGWRNA